MVSMIFNNNVENIVSLLCGKNIMEIESYSTSGGANKQTRTAVIFILLRPSRKKKEAKKHKSIQRVFRAYVQIDCVLNCQYCARHRKQGEIQSLSWRYSSQRRSRPGTLQSHHTVKSAVLHVNMGALEPQKNGSPSNQGGSRAASGRRWPKTCSQKQMGTSRMEGHSWQERVVHCGLERPWWASLVAQW